jgi:hypothetical protein
MHLGLHVLRKIWSSAAISTRHEHKHGQNLFLLPQSRITHSYNAVSPLADTLALFSVCAVWSSVPSYTPLLSHLLCPQSSLPHTEEGATPPRNPFAFLHEPNTLDRDCAVFPQGETLDKIAVPRNGFDSVQKYGASRGSASFRPSLVSTRGSGKDARKQFAAPRSQGTPFHFLS